MSTLITDELVAGLSDFIAGNTPTDLEKYNQLRRLRDILFEYLSPEVIKRIKLKPRQEASLIKETLILIENSSIIGQKILRAFNSPSPMDYQKHRADILLVTATQLETKAFIDEANSMTQQSHKKYFAGNQTHFYLGNIGGSDIYLTQSGMGSSGVEGSMLSIAEAILSLSPNAIIMAGIAFGMKPKKQKIGDILVAQQLLSYEIQRISTSSEGMIHVAPRGDRVTGSPKLLNRFRAGQIEWSGANVQFGLVLSGEKLVDNVDFKKRLLLLEPEAIGGEMEGTGLYAAAQRSKTDWLLVKAICDWADGNKKYNKEGRQQLAARNAAKFVLHVLKQGSF